MFYLNTDAIISAEQSGFTVILDNKNSGEDQYQDAPLFYGQPLAIRTPKQDTPLQKAPDNNVKTLQSAAMGRGAKVLQKASSLKKAKKTIPEQIRRMRNLYQYGNGSFKQICKNFYVQGKFMEDYEDNAPWNGEVSSYYVVTYHSLSLDELRGYFTWRTELRKGNYRKHCRAFTLIYLNELINGIGTSSAEESLHKMQEFERGYIDAGFGGFDNTNLRNTLRRWMLEFAVLSGVAPEIARTYAGSKMLEKDAGIEILHNPEKFGDQEVFHALCTFGGKKTAESKPVQQHATEAIGLFAAVWRLASAQYRSHGETLFDRCFGSPKAQRWYPLEYALYYNPKKRKAGMYRLNASRSYRFMRDEWHVLTYQSYYFNRKIIVDLLHETDRRVRLYLKVGHPLKERKEAAWAAPYIEAVIEADRQAKIEAARPKITIDFAGLDKIRQDALETQDNLLTEEDTQGATQPAAKQGGKSAGSADTAGLTEDTEALIEAKAAEAAGRHTEPGSAALSASASVPLDGTQIRLLQMLLRGEPVQTLIAAQHGLPYVIADSVNEALFDHIGDNAVDCDGETVTLVEDYRDDIAKIVGGENKIE